MQKIKLSIPEPCHENWNNMTPSDHGRFCNACAKSVIDFSSMTDTEVLNYFSRVKEDNICGRVYPDQLERTIQTPAGKRTGWYWNYMLAFFFLFTKSNNAKAQGAIKISNTLNPDSTKKTSPGTKPIHPVQYHMPLRLGKIYMGNKPLPGKALHEVNTALINSNIQISGTIIDGNGLPIPGASVIVLPSGKGISTSEDGAFLLSLDPMKCSLKISAVGYEEKIINSFDTLQQKITLKQAVMNMGEVVITGNVNRRLTGMMGSLSVTRTYTMADTIKNFFSVANPAINIYPNPAQAGSTVKIELKLKPGTYNLQILDATGKIIMQKKVRANSAKFIEQLRVEKAWTGGNYFIRVFDSRNKIVEGVGLLVL